MDSMNLSLDEFLARAGAGKPILVHRDLLADVETPLSTYWKLAHDQTYSFLLESVTGGEQLARYSMIGIQPSAVLRTKDQAVCIETKEGVREQSLAPGEDGLHELKKLMPEAPEAVEGMPKFIGGAVGMIAYDYVRFLEKLPDKNPDVLGVPDVAMMIARITVVFDHAKNLIRILILADPTQEGYDEAMASLEWVSQRIQGPLPTLPKGSFPTHPVTSDTSQEQYEANVRRVVEYLGAGDGQQTVASLRFSQEVDAHPVTVYRCLRSINPSPYMFVLRFGDFDIVGASPELLVGLSGTTAKVRPIAGTRWRGATEAEDQALADELIADEKERAEHVMLIDLGRNDLGRVCEFGTVHVDDLMVIERYSHVMHIVSSVTGTLKSGMDGFDLVRATFPAGTVSGAPKVRAMEIIEELETTRRGLYAGAIGYFSATGDVDTAIALRTILMKDGKAHVQAGAGLVFDSQPTKEYEECRNKARAALRALEMAQQGLA